MNNYISKIKNPSKRFRPIPFWSWNDRLDPKVLEWQAVEMKQAGLGGYFMHARGGIETEYLGEEWMKCVSTCIDVSKSDGIDSWIYDEAGWPSGFAGGIVTAMGEKFHARWLKMTAYLKESNDIEKDNILGAYVIADSGNKIIPVQVEDVKKGSINSERIVMVQAFSNPYYIDVMNQDAVKAFIKCTHEKYHELFGEDFGKYMKGFFTDEPRLFWNREGDMPWSLLIPEKFQAKYGYSILEKLPLLFIKGEGYEQLRYDYWSLVSELFTKSYMKQIYDWCNDHNCQLTGHVMMEESIFTQMTGTSGVMPFYQYMHIPGIDWLRRTISTPVVPKQVGSVACQLGKESVLTESYALSGWSISFEEMKWIAEWQFVNGVNLMCQHLEAYTLRGLRKRDYPPSLFIQQPWWEKYKLFNDYLARLGVLLTSGEPVVNLLVIHPMHSGWIAFDGFNNDVIRKLDSDFIQLSETLSGLHIDYHYGDETILDKYASIEGSSMKVGQCSYKAVLLPNMISIDYNTLKLLISFSENGGNIFCMSQLPEFCKGASEEELKFLEYQCIPIGSSRNDIYNTLKNAHLINLSISDCVGEVENIHYQQRDLGDRVIYFIVNHNNTNAYDTVITLKGIGTVKKLSVENAELEDIAYSFVKGNTVLKLKFLPMQSHVLIIEKCIKELLPNEEMEELNVIPKKEWLLKNVDLNCLTLDYCSYSIDNGDWKEPIPVIHLMDKLLALKHSCQIEMKFSFQVEMNLIENREFWLVAEKAEEFDIIVNGYSVQYKDDGWWKDTSFKKVNIKPLILEGKNEIILKRRFFQQQKVYDVLYGNNVYETEKNKLTYDVELESIYLIGDFGVYSKSEYEDGNKGERFTEGPFVVTDRPKVVSSGDLTSQGFCFFAGNIELTQNIYINSEKEKKVILKLEKPNCTMSMVFINDKLAKEILWGPYNIDITNLVHNGENKLTIKLLGSNRNLLGPHHHAKGELYNVGPLSFTGKWSWVERETEAVVITEEDRRKTYWQDKYCFVPFGLR